MFDGENIGAAAAWKFYLLAEWAVKQLGRLKRVHFLFDTFLLAWLARHVTRANERRDVITRYSGQAGG